MDAKRDSRKVFCVLAAIAVAFTASLVWHSQQAYAASSTVAYVTDSSGTTMGRYDDLQAALDAVNDRQSVYLTKDIEASKTFKINRGKTFNLRLNGYTITSATTSLTYILRIESGNVTIYGGSARKHQPGLIATSPTRCIRLDSGRLNIWTANNNTVFRGARVADVYGGELNITGGTFENSIVVYNSAAQLNISGGMFEKRVSISAKGANACTMNISGGEFLAKITNTGKTGFITGGKYHYLRMPNDKYIHTDYYKVKDSITREGQTETAYRIVKRPPSVAVTPASGSVEYDPTGSGRQVTAKVVDSDRTTELTPATFTWYKDDAVIGEGASFTLNEPGTYKAIGRYNNVNYEAEYVVKPANISSGYESSLTQGATFTGFPYGKDFVESNVQLFKDGSSTKLDNFTCTVKTAGENINAGTGSGTYTIMGIDNYTGTLSGTFDIAQADFSQVDFTVNPAKTVYTGREIKPTVAGTLTTNDKVYTLDPSEYSVTYDNNTNVGTATITVTSVGKNFKADKQTLNFQINKAPNNVSVSIGDWASGDTASTPSVTASSGATNASYDYKVKGASDDTYKSDVPTAPGEYTVKATVPATANYEEGTATADFTIKPMPLTIESATAKSRAYETGNKTVEIESVTFKHGDERISLTKGSDYTASGVMSDPNAGESKNVDVTVTLANGNYSLATATTTTTVGIAKSTAPTETVRVVGYITYEDGGAKRVDVTQSVANMAPADAGSSPSYKAGTPDAPNGVTVQSFVVNSNGTVTATLKNVEQSDDNKNVTLPVTFSSQNYNDSLINIVVVPKDKTVVDVSVAGVPTNGKTYGDEAFTLTATAKNGETSEPVETQANDWWWYSSDESVLKVAKEQGSNTMSVSVVGVGSAMIMAWYETDSNPSPKLGAAITEPIAVNKRPLTITAVNKDDIYVGGTVPELNASPALAADYTIGPAEGGLVNGDKLSDLKLAYSPAVDNAKPGPYAIVPSGASVKKDGMDVSANYAISYVNGALTIKSKEPQEITAKDVTVTYGDEGKNLSASLSVGEGTLSYAVTSGRDCIDVNATTGALTIKKAGTATVAVTASETTTHAQTTKSVTVTVNKAKSIPATVSDPDLGWSYDGTERRLAVVEGAVVGGVMQYSTDGETFSDSIPTATDPGEYAIWYKVAGDENHNDSTTEKIDVEVYKADPVVPEIGTLNATCGDLLETVELPSNDIGTWNWTEDPGRIVEHAGENHFEAEFTPNDTKYYNTIPGVFVTVNAAKGTSSVATAPKANTLTYNGKAQALVTAGTATGGTMLYALDEGNEIYDAPPTGTSAGDYRVWYMTNGNEDYNDSDPAFVDVTIARASISKANVTLAQTSVTYDGKAKEPAVKSVTLNGETLKAGTDYDVSYKDNVKTGTATVTVTGKGNYTGTATTKFTISEKPADPTTNTSIANAKVTLAKTSMTYTGKARKPAVKSVVLDGKALAAETDYTVSYANNKKLGTATVTVTGKGSYTGTATAGFTIKLARAKRPTVVKAKAGVISAKWAKVKGAKKYQLQWRAKGGKWKTKTVKSRKATIKGLKKGKRYDLRVRAVSGKFKGAWSAQRHRKLSTQSSLAVAAALVK